MRPADELSPEQLVGKRVAFRDDADHADCWHQQVGLRTGVVLRRVHTMAQKAELLGPDLEIPPELLEDEVPRLWVKADPCAALPRGCETAVEAGCLLIADG
jgi:hypothetical protein